MIFFLFNAQANANVIRDGVVKIVVNELVSRIAICMGRVIMASVNATNIGKAHIVQSTWIFNVAKVVR
jgi:hypothetical protein|tara:strand:+ start:355 stop:558 length:204 start_codon:yes stop_codon:yes gene_type:complete